MFLFGSRNSGGIDTFLSSLSKLGIVVFFVTVVISLWLLAGKFGLIFLYGFAIYASLGIAFLVTLIFEFIYRLFRGGSNLQ